MYKGFLYVKVTIKLKKKPQPSRVHSTATGTDPQAGGSKQTPVSSHLVSESRRKTPPEAQLKKISSEEADYLQKCKAAVEKMKSAVVRQRSVSAAIKTAIVELEDAFDALTFLRRSRERAEWCLRELGQTREPDVLTTTKKRGLSSPGETQDEKRKKEAKSDETPQDSAPHEEEWKEQRPRRRAVRKAEDAILPTRPAAKDNKKNKTSAILIKPPTGKSFADILKNIRKKVVPEATGTEVRSIRQTRSGGVLIELEDNTKDKSTFQAEIQKVLGEDTAVSSLEPKTTLEILDLDECTEEDEVQAALLRDYPDIGEVKVGLTPANSRGQRVAILQLPDRLAGPLLTVGKIKIGWVYSRIRRRATVTRCFKCLGFGHLSNRCTGPDRSHACYKCGEVGHKSKTCEAAEKCLLCAAAKSTDTNHLLGSGRCMAFRVELEKARKALR